ncbi:hypothetical protein [Iningainema tapete]|uniref:Uncharacterized protein n=1 Tax=Iningainema tapete BLCC-T55 TaxID=2748662 RepID=A0A8J6XD93_9CYAN|nr:hypothetical protein [Iningainema tapete]MBD2773079.1 hypothetical protein [Iningainema tapete BLCC-T55]
MPNLESRLSIVQVHNLERPLEDVNLAHWAAVTEGWNGADLALMARSHCCRSNPSRSRSRFDRSCCNPNYK